MTLRMKVIANNITPQPRRHTIGTDFFTPDLTGTATVDLWASTHTFQTTYPQVSKPCA